MENTDNIINDNTEVINNSDASQYSIIIGIFIIIVILIFLYLAKRNSCAKSKRNKFSDKKNDKENQDLNNTDDTDNKHILDNTKYDIIPEINKFLEKQDMNIS